MSAGLVLAVPAAVALDAPQGVWIGVAVAAGMCFAAAVIFHVREGRAAPPQADRVELLRDQYRKGKSLQQSLVWAGGLPEARERQHEADARAQAEARQWGEGARRVIALHFPEHEREFFGNGDHALGATGFAIASEQEIKRPGGSPNNYLERQLVLIERLIKRYS